MFARRECGQTGWLAAQLPPARKLAECNTMPAESSRVKKFLFVDDDTNFLAGIR